MWCSGVRLDKGRRARWCVAEWSGSAAKSRAISPWAGGVSRELRKILSGSTARTATTFFDAFVVQPLGFQGAGAELGPSGLNNQDIPGLGRAQNTHGDIVELSDI